LEYVEELKLRKNEVDIFTEDLILEGNMPIINFERKNANYKLRISLRPAILFEVFDI
jgi:hypothetical protein